MNRLRGTLVLWVGLWPAVAWAAPPENLRQDILLTLRARKLLFDDDVLGPHNLGVKVHGRVALLWGPVPTTELALRAEARLRGLIELIDVRNELFVFPAAPGEAIFETPPPTLSPLPGNAPPALPPPRPFLQIAPRKPRAWLARAESAPLTPSRSASVSSIARLLP